MPPLQPADKVPANLVAGCQSQLYLHTRLEGGSIYFRAEADALIAAGLAYLLTFVYSGETCETVMTCEPHYLRELEIGASLSPGRANGLAALHLRMKQEALRGLALL